jgi:hypothetical protein
MGGAEPGAPSELFEVPGVAEGALEQELLEDPAEVVNPLGPNMLPRPRGTVPGVVGVLTIDGALEVVLVVDPGLGAVPGAQGTVCGVEPMATSYVEGVVIFVAVVA